MRASTCVFELWIASNVQEMVAGNTITISMNANSPGGATSTN